jgi:hypothetical protein
MNRASTGLTLVGNRSREAISDLVMAGALLVLAVVVGIVAARAPFVAVAIASVGTLGLLLRLKSRLTVAFLALMPCLLLGYMLFDRAFAYIGVYPVFVSELVLLVAVLHLVISARHIQLSRLHWALIAFMLLGALRTLPYLETYGVNALRDGALWGYGIFALALSAAVGERHFRRIVSLYVWAVPLFLIWTPIAGFVARAYPGQLPTVLGSDVPVLSLKSGDLGVHLAGVGAFLVVGLNRDRLAGAAAQVLTWTLWIIGVGIVGSANRGSLLAASTAILGALLVRPAARTAARFGLALVLAATIAGVAPELSVAGQRSLSVDQVVLNVTSIFVDTGAPALEGSKEWRTLWWNEIIDYTFGGQYFWTGKGFGINLADDDGFPVDAEGSLRSPHNGHLNVLARMGVPGLAAWIALQLWFGASLLWSFYRARRQGAMFWCQIDVWLFVYWLAMIVDASFDVFFEGPQGGIWFWSIFGLGLAAIRIQNSLFRQAEDASETILPTPVSVRPAFPG